MTAGRIDQSGVFTPPSISEPCQVTVTSGGRGQRSGDDHRLRRKPAAALGRRLDRAALRAGPGPPAAGSSVLATSDANKVAVSLVSASSSISAGQLHLDELLAGAWARAWPAAGLDTRESLPVGGHPHARQARRPRRFTSSTSWTVGDTTYTALETDWSTGLAVADTVAAVAGTIRRTTIANYTIVISGGASPTTASGSMTARLALGGDGPHTSLRHGLRHRQREVRRRHLERKRPATRIPSTRREPSTDYGDTTATYT